ncbi:MAG TPA: hypothetical protein VHD36_21225 [Pirellulales bacterium]|nr:hypothetical protein [Pirellulales bacterium]
MRRLIAAAATIGILVPLVAVGQWFAPAPYFNGFGPSTAAESYQRGFADVVRSAGSANLMDSMAAQNYEQARSMDIQNRLQWTEAYYQMRKANRAYRASKRSPRLSQNEIMRFARVGLPTRLTSTQLDPLTGQLNWPIILRDAQYADDREQLDKLFAERATASSISPDVFRQVQQVTGDLLAALKKNINEYQANDWIAAKKFVESLAYDARFPAG